MRLHMFCPCVGVVKLLRAVIASDCFPMVNHLVFYQAALPLELCTGAQVTREWLLIAFGLTLIGAVFLTKFAAVAQFVLLVSWLLFERLLTFFATVDSPVV